MHTYFFIFQISFVKFLFINEFINTFFEIFSLRFNIRTNTKRCPDGFTDCSAKLLLFL